MLSYLKSLLLENRGFKQTLAKNTFWLAVGQIGARFVRVILIIYAARVLGAEGWGIFSYALSVAALFTILIDFGINALITRESSKDLALQEKYFATGLIIKLVMFFLVAIILIFIAPHFLNLPAVIALMPIVAAIVGFDSLKDFGASLSRAWEKMEIEAYIQVATNVAIVLGGFLALHLANSPGSLAYGYMAGTVVGMLLAFYPVRSYFKNLKKSFSWSLVKPIFVSAWPIALLGLLASLMLNTDTLLIGWFLSAKEVGYYTSGQRIAQMLYMLPGIIASAFFPSFAKMTKEPERLRGILNKCLSLLNMLSLPAALGGAILAPQIIQMLFGREYLPGASSFLLLSLAIPFVFFSAVLSNAAFAIGQERKLFSYSILGFCGNAIFDLIFIPIWGIAGSALSTLINQIIITVYLYYSVKSYADFQTILKGSRNAITASILMVVAVVVSIKFNLSIYAILPIGALVYLSYLYYSREPMLKEFWSVFKNKS